MEWISVEDKVPNSGEIVLGFNCLKEYEDFGPYFILTFYNNDVWDVINDSSPINSTFIQFKPTYWMLLPSPPVNEEKTYDI